MDDENAALTCYLVEWYNVGSPNRPITDVARTLRRSLATVFDEPDRPRLLYAVEVSQDSYAFGVFTADSAEQVIRACRQAGLPADRVTAAAHVSPADATGG